MSMLWLFFASLTVVGSALYNFGMKAGSPHANMFGFVFLLNVCLVLVNGGVTLIAKYLFKVDIAQGINLQVAKYALICGAAAGMIDFCYLLALRYGGLIPTQMVWTVGGLVTVSAVAVLFFGETITLTKAIGLCLGIVSVFLIAKAP